MFRYSGDPILTFERRSLPENFDRAEIRFLALVPPVSSFELRLLAGEQRRYLASQFFYGTGLAGPTGDPQQTAPVDIRLNVTSGLRMLLADDRSETVAVRGVAVDRSAREIRDPELRFREAVIVVV